MEIEVGQKYAFGYKPGVVEVVDVLVNTVCVVNVRGSIEWVLKKELIEQVESGECWLTTRNWSNLID